MHTFKEVVYQPKCDIRRMSHEQKRMVGIAQGVITPKNVRTGRKKSLDFCRILNSTSYTDFVLWLRQNDCTAKYFWKGLRLSETSISTSRYLVLSRVLLHRSSPSTMVASNRNALNRDPPRILSATVLFAKYLHTSRIAPSRILYPVRCLP